MRADHKPESPTAALDAPPVRFDWLLEELPGGPWSVDLRAAVCQGIKTLGWEAVARGDFGELESLYRDVVSILPRLLVDRSDADRAADLYTLAHIMLWRRTQLLSELASFNADVVKPFVAYLDCHFAKAPARPMIRDVPRIAYLSETSDLFGSNAVARITVSLMLGQNELRPIPERPILYCINRPAEDLNAFAREHGLPVRDMARPTPLQSVEAIIAQLVADDIDILIADSNCAVATMVMQRRPARVQAFHENGFAPWAIPELDLAFMGITKPSPGLFDARVDMVQTPRNTAFVFQKSDRPADIVEAVRKAILTGSGVPRPSVVYGFYGRMAKITTAYMAAVEAILLRDPRAIFFAGGTGCISPIVAYRERSKVADQMVIYNAFIDGHVVAECLDVFLDSFPFPGGMSCIEVQARGVPVVWMAAPESDRMSIIDDQRDECLKAHNTYNYAKLASRLADPAERAVRADTARAIAHRFSDMRGQAEQVEGHLKEVWTRARQQGTVGA